MATALYSQKKAIPGSHTTGADRLFWLLFLSKLTESVTCGISNSQTGMVNLKISRSAVCHFPTPLSWMHQKIQYLPVLSVSVWLPFDKFKIITKTGKTVSCLRRAAQEQEKRERKSWPEFSNSKSVIHHSTYINEIFSLENICDFIHDNVIFGPSKSIKMHVLNDHLKATHV